MTSKSLGLPASSSGRAALCRRCLAASLVWCLACVPVFASSFAGSSAGTSAGGTSASSGSTSGDDKVVLAAREDAAGFIATDGALRTVRLESALRYLRARDPASSSASDLMLARAILAR